MRKSKPLYDKKSDSLQGLTKTEKRLIDELSSLRLGSKAKEILEEYYNKSRNKKTFLKRLDQIFSCYYRWGALNMNPFSFNQGIVTDVLNHLDTLRNKPSREKSPIADNTIVSRSKSESASKNTLSLATLIKPFSRWNKLRQILIEEEILTKGFYLNLKGNGWKKRTVFLINELENKHYWDHRLSSEQMMKLIKNTFNINISREYIDKVNREKHPDDFSFIPESSKIS